MSKGITPVIAIILLLLMAVAAAGGFYFVYQGFTEEGEESGSTQIESLGEQSLAALQIESAAGGRIYVKNVGASDVDLSKVSVYVENQPVSVNRSSDTLAERSRAVLKFTQPPSCEGDCEVRISGAASTSRTLDSSKLSCASDADCYSGESCEGGVCVEGEEEAAVCGDGTCDAGEDGENCYDDCGPQSLLFPVPDVPSLPPGTCTLRVFEWNGTTYVGGDDLTDGTQEYWMTDNVFDSDGSGFWVGWAAEVSTSSNWEIATARYDGDSWSSPTNRSDNDWQDTYLASGLDFNSTGDALLLWGTGTDGGTDAGWASWDGSSWSEQQNITQNPSSTDLIMPTFAFAPDDSGMAVWATSDGSSDWVNYSLWDGGWGETGAILSLEDELDQELKLPIVKSNGTHMMAAWIRSYTYMPGDADDVLQWSTWDVSEGGPWSPVQNFSDELGTVMLPVMETDKNGDFLFVYSDMTNGALGAWPEWYSWEDGWVLEGNVTDSDPLGFSTHLFKNENDALTLILTTIETGFYEFDVSYWDGTAWTEPADIPGFICIYL